MAMAYKRKYVSMYNSPSTRYRTHARRSGYFKKPRNIRYTNKSSNFRQGSRVTATNSANAFPFPRTKNTTVRYVATDLTVNPGVGGTAATYMFRATSAYDPDLTGAGHQPLMYDQYMSYYAKYMVRKARIKVTYFNQDTSHAAIVGIINSNLSAAESTDIQALMEQGRGVWTTMQKKTGSDRDSVTLVHEMDVAKFANIRNLGDDSDWKGGQNTSPLNNLFFHIIGAPVDSSVDHSGIKLLVELEQDVQFSSPKFVNSS